MQRLSWQTDSGVSNTSEMDDVTARLHNSCHEENVTRQLLDSRRFTSLLESNADPSVYGIDGLTPLMAAAQTGYFAAVEILIGYHADVNARAQTKSRWTPLMFAAANNHNEVAQRLLDANADVTMVDAQDGMSAAEVADEYDHPDLMQLINNYISRHGNNKDSSSQNQNSEDLSIVPNNGYGRPADVQQWTTDDVCSWAKEAKLDEYFFREHDIDGEFLLELDDGLLADLKMNNRAKRLKVILKLRKLKGEYEADAGENVGNTWNNPSGGVPLHLTANNNGGERVSEGGRFEKVKILGRGSFGTTALVKDRKTGEFFAKKELICLNQKDANIALREAVTMLNVRSSWLVACHDVFLGHDANQMLCVNIIMEYCDRGDLSDILCTQDVITPSDCNRWITSILKGLDFIHDKNIIHRDLKPDNILITGDPPVAKLGDFGLARKTNIDVMSVAGTLSYMAPEIIRCRSYGTAVDIWSLGIIMVEASAHSRLQQPSSNPEEVQDAIDTIPKHFGNEFISMVSRMLSIDPDKRPCAKDLLKEVEQRSVEVRPSHGVSVKVSDADNKRLSPLVANKEDASKL